MKTGLPLFAILLLSIVFHSQAENEPTSVPDGKPALPRLVDLGAEKCIPCKMMKPILDDLTQNYADQFQVEFIDVWKNREAGATYGIRMIPTQIFFDASGKQLSRHEGFLAKKDILVIWQKHGITIVEPSAQAE